MDTITPLTASFTAADNPPASGIPAPALPSQPARPEQRPKARPNLNPIRVMRATANPIRWGILGLLSEGAPMAAVQLAKRLRADQDNVTKHLRVLELAGLIFARPGEDARLRLYGIRPALQAGEQDGMRLYDLGFCVLRFPMPAGAREPEKAG